MMQQWKWTDVYGRVHGVVNGFTAFAPGKPDKYQFKFFWKIALDVLEFLFIYNF